MPAPDDADTVLAALRLGWYVAEVRGRNRPDTPAEPITGLPSLQGHPLRLQIEWTPIELRVQAQAVLIALAEKLEIDTNQSDDSGKSYSQEVDRQARNLEQMRRDGKPDGAQWHSLTELLFTFDAHIQDSLTAKSDFQARGYQLGRALAECYWALDPNLSGDSRSPAAWSFLLGRERCDEIGRLLGSLSAYLPPYTAPAIAGSIRVWQSVAADPKWRGIAHEALHRQVRTWYELVVLGRDPLTFVKPYARLRNLRIFARAIGFFRGQLLLIAVGVAALVALFVLLGSGASTAVTNTVLAILAAAGISTAGLSAGRFRQDVNTDMAAIAITTAPPPPPGRSRAYLDLVRQRSL
jgi:hypothetical protein